MNKSAIALGALLLAGSVAFAAEPGGNPQPNDTSGVKVRRGMGDVKESFKDMGRSARNVAHDIAHPHDRRRAAVTHENTTGYGGAQADMSQDAQRRARMDAAYANWQARR